jgi:hypothetical protein
MRLFISWIGVLNDNVVMGETIMKAQRVNARMLQSAAAQIADRVPGLESVSILSLQDIGLLNQRRLNKVFRVRT